MVLQIFQRLRDSILVSHGRAVAMDGVRGLAVLIVFLSHTSGREQSLLPVLQFHGIGHVGVYLFFALSGYLLASNLIDEWSKNGSISIRNFLIRRFFRIAPLYYFVLTAVFLYQQVTNAFYPRYLHIDDGFVGYVKHLLFIKGDGVFWTLPTEFVFYLVLPWLVLLCIRKGNLALKILAIVATLYFIWFLLIITGRISEGLALKLVEVKHPSQFLDVFICGVLAAFLQKSTSVNLFIQKNLKLIDRVTFFILLATLIVTFSAISFKFLIFERPFYNLRWASLIYGIIFSIIILSASLDGRVSKVFKNNMLRFMGVVGFSWYLVHFFVLQSVNYFSLAAPVKFLISTSVLVVLTSTLYMFIEKPFIEMAKKMTKKYA